MSDLTAMPQISSYTPLDIESTYVLVTDEYSWEIGLWIDSYADEEGAQWYELQYLDDPVSTFDALESICIKLPHRMNMVEAIAYLKDIGVL